MLLEAQLELNERFINHNSTQHYTTHQQAEHKSTVHKFFILNLSSFSMSKYMCLFFSAFPNHSFEKEQEKTAFWYVFSMFSVGGLSFKFCKLLSILEHNVWKSTKGWFAGLWFGATWKEKYLRIFKQCHTHWAVGPPYSNGGKKKKSLWEGYQHPEHNTKRQQVFHCS